jgi:hypothetical protein
MAKEVFWFVFVHGQKLKNGKNWEKEENRPPRVRDAQERPAAEARHEARDLAGSVARPACLGLVACAVQPRRMDSIRPARKSGPGRPKSVRFFCT